MTVASPDWKWHSRQKWGTRQESRPPLFPTLPIVVLEDLKAALDSALRDSGVVNVSLIAEQIRARNVDANIAREDIEFHLMHAAQRRSAAIEFDHSEVR